MWMLRIKHSFITFFLKLFDAAEVFGKALWIKHCLRGLSNQNRRFLKILTNLLSILKYLFFSWRNTTLNIFLSLNLRIRSLVSLSIDLIKRIKEILKHWLYSCLRDNSWFYIQFIFSIWVRPLLAISCLLFLWTLIAIPKRVKFIIKSWNILYGHSVCDKCK